LVHRVEIITGKERRRRWSGDEKRRLVTEAFGPGAIVAQVARLHGVAESCLYTWRKRFGENIPNGVAPDRPQLIPVMIEGTSAASGATTAAPPSDPPPLSRHAIITLPDGTRLEIAAGYPVSALKALILALRQTR
jgi:transposase